MSRDRRDPFDLLVAMVPGGTNTVVQPGDDTVADALLDSILALTDEWVESPAAPTTTPLVAATADRRRRPRRRLAIGAAVIGLAGITAGAIAAVWETRPDDTVSLACYSDAAAVPREMVALVAIAGVAAVDQCAALWTDGTFSRSGAPELTACVTPAGVTAVLPGDASTCARLGFAAVARPTPDQVVGEEVDRQVVSAIADLFAGRCVDDVVVAREQVQAVLDGLGASEWSVRTSARLDSVRRCAAPSVDALDHTVQIVAVPG